MKRVWERVKPIVIFFSGVGLGLASLRLDYEPVDALIFAAFVPVFWGFFEGWKS
jgi:hypothetical protein